MTDHAIEAVARVLSPNCMWDEGYVNAHQERRREIARAKARNATAAYEAALWRPIEDHDGSNTPVMLEYETPHGELSAEPAWYEADVMQRGWWEANLDHSDSYAQTFEGYGCIPRRFRPLPSLLEN